jgi:hypothetical protein
MSPSTVERASPLASPARVLIALPDAGALRRAAGLLGYLSARKRQVVAGVQDDPPGGISLGRFDGAYVGLSVARLPAPEDDGWQSLAAVVRTRLESGKAPRRMRAMLHGVDVAIPPSRAAVALLRREAPDVLVVGRLRHGAHLDYLRAARQQGVPSIYLTLRADDVARGGLALALPDCIAVWNSAQRREAKELGLPILRTVVIGAHLWTDVLDVRETRPRDEWCRRLGIDPSRRVMVVGPVGEDAPARQRWLTEWNAARAASSDAGVRGAATVVVIGPGVWPAVATEIELRGAEAVIAAGADFADQCDAASRLHQALACADAVVAGDDGLALEGLARALPVIACRGREDVDALTVMARRMGEWPCSAATPQDAVACLPPLLDGRARVAVATGRAIVRPHGDEVEPGFLLARVIKDIECRDAAPALTSPRHRLAGWAAARRWPAAALTLPHDAGLGALFVVALPESLGSHWRALFEVLALRGHRVALVAERDVAALAAAAAGLHGVWVTGRLGARPSGAGERTVAALDARWPELSGAEDASETRWRRRFDGVMLPTPIRGLETLQGRSAALARVRALRDVLDASLSPSRTARRLVDRERPDAVVVLPSLDPATAIASWTAHLDLLRAARGRGVPVMASRLGTDAVEEALAQGALRPNGVSRATAAAIVDALEGRLRGGTRQRTPANMAPLLRVAALAALKVLSAVAVIRRRVATGAQRADAPANDGSRSVTGRGPAR